MAHSFDVVVDSAAGVEQVHAAFATEEYWQARFLAIDAAVTLDELIVDTDGAVTVDTTEHLARGVLPGSIAKLVPGDLTVSHREVWRPTGDGRVRGQISISAPAARGSGTGQAWLTPADPAGSRLHLAATVRVKIPLVGGTVERLAIGSVQQVEGGDLVMALG